MSVCDCMLKDGIMQICKKECTGERIWSDRVCCLWVPTLYHCPSRCPPARVLPARRSARRRAATEAAAASSSSAAADWLRRVDGGGILRLARSSLPSRLTRWSSVAEHHFNSSSVYAVGPISGGLRNCSIHMVLPKTAPHPACSDAHCSGYCSASIGLR